MWFNFREFLVLCNWTQTVQIRCRHLRGLDISFLASSAVSFAVFAVLMAALYCGLVKLHTDISKWRHVVKCFIDQLLGAWLVHGSRLKRNCWYRYRLELLGLPFWWRLLLLVQRWWHGSWTVSAGSCPEMWELLLWHVTITWRWHQFMLVSWAVTSGSPGHASQLISPSVGVISSVCALEWMVEETANPPWADNFSLLL